MTYNSLLYNLKLIPLTNRLIMTQKEKFLYLYFFMIHNKTASLSAIHAYKKIITSK